MQTESSLLCSKQPIHYQSEDQRLKLEYYSCFVWEWNLILTLSEKHTHCQKNDEENIGTSEARNKGKIKKYCVWVLFLDTRKALLEWPNQQGVAGAKGAPLSDDTRKAPLILRDANCYTSTVILWVMTQRCQLHGYQRSEELTSPWRWTWQASLKRC